MTKIANGKAELNSQNDFSLRKRGVSFGISSAKIVHYQHQFGGEL